MNIADYLDFSNPDEIRIKGHRINIETILFEYLDGMVPEEIAAQHPTLSQEEIYATITYYWHNQDQIAAYLQRAEDLEEEMLQAQKRNPSPAVVRMRQLLRQRNQENPDPEQVSTPLV